MTKNMDRKSIALLGSTGSIGCQTLDVVNTTNDLDICAMAAGNNWQLLAEQANKYHPKLVALADSTYADALKAQLPAGTDLLTGQDAMCELVQRCGCDMLVSAVVGSAGLAPTLAAIDAGADLAIANKETLVMAGAIVMPAAAKAGVRVLPVDSEHSAIFQCLASGKRSEVQKVVVTASGGALRDMDDESAAAATLEQALKHPTWQMGQKITIDSATLMNKALEVVEAHWLFDLSADQIDVVIHPESIIHSCVEFCDGSMIAQMGHPDMTLPIAHALHWPDRPVREPRPLDLAELANMTFRELSPRGKRAVDLGFEVIRRGGVSGAVLNGANEAAVQAFCDGKILFGRIIDLVEDILNKTPSTDEVTLKALIEADIWARRQVDEALKA